ncbi:MAG: hypothetical protein R2791_16750 [Saprospiraceae bacterium]
MYCFRPVFPSRFIWLFLFFSSIANAQSQWAALNAPEGGRILQIAEIGDEYWACTRNGLFRSSDDGQSWQQDALFGEFFRVSGLAQYGDTIYLYSNEATLTGSESRFYTSTDNGLNWSFQTLDNSNFPGIGTSPPQSISSIFRIDDVLFIVTSFQLTRSLDGGASWEELINSAGSHFAWDKKQILHVAYNAAYVSGDYGFSWEYILKITPPVTPGKPQIEGNDIYLPRSDSLLVSHDLGQSWTRTTVPFLNLHNAASWKTGNDVLYSELGENVFTSPDFGLSWSIVNSAPIPAPYRTPGSVLIKGNTIMAGSEFGIFRSDDLGSSWARNSTGLHAYFTFDLQHNTEHIFAQTSGEVFRSDDQGQIWQPVFSKFAMLQYNVITFGVLGNEVYVLDNDGNIHYSPDNGDHFGIIANLAPHPVFRKNQAIDDTYYYFNANQVVIFQNGSLQDSFRVVLAGMDVGINDFYEKDGRYFVLPTNISLGGKLVYSDDQGQSWQASDLIDTDFKGNFYRIQDRLFAAGLYVFYSDDNGASWHKATASPFLRLNDICQHGDKLYAFGGAQIAGNLLFFSEDMGDTWEQLDTPPFGLSHEIYALQTFKNHLYTCALSSGIWRIDLTTPVTEPGAAATGQTLRVQPNPADRLATVYWNPPAVALAKAGKLTVFSSDGRVVWEYALASGSTHCDLDTGQWPSGVYTIQFDLGKERLYGRLVKP